VSKYRFSIRSDIARNVVYIDQHGQPTKADLERLGRAMLTETAKLSGKITVVNDQREMEPLDQKNLGLATELVELSNQLGVTRVIRIVPPDFLATAQIASTLVEGKSRYTSIHVTSLEEAEEALETLL
jgi:hypothetical protein